MRVGVVRGGVSGEYEQSLATGETVLRVLRDEPEKYDALDIFISKDGVWHVGGMVREPERVLPHIDVVFNALHGEYGEDGSIQKILKLYGVPHTGSDTVGSALTSHLHFMRDRLAQEGFLVPRYAIIKRDATLDDVHYIFRNYVHPVVITPVRNGRSFGRKLASTYDELKTGLADAFTYFEKVLVEETVKGKEVLCGVIEHFRGERMYALVPEPQLSIHENKMIEALARRTHNAFGLRHYSLSRFLITPKGKVYVLDVRSQPELHRDTPFMRSLKYVGIRPNECIEHLLDLANNK